MKKWTYRFKRGLASFLAVGMIAGGVSGATCLPVYAVEAPSVNQEDVNDGIQQITKGLKTKISEMFNKSEPMGEAKFEVEVQLKKGGSDENDQLLKNIGGNASKILGELLKENPSELFWYDSAGKLNDSNLPYGCDWKDKERLDGNKFKATFILQLAVKEDYKGTDWENNPISINIAKVRQKKAAVDKTAELEETSAKVYDQVKEQIKGLNVAKKGQAEFTVSFPVGNEEEYEILKELIEARVQNIVPSLLADGDCSSELFWYDESSIVDETEKTSYKWAVWPSDNKQTCFFTLKLAVKPEYRVADSKEAISLDVEKINKIKKQVDLGENKEWDDYSILKTYKDAICADSGDAIDPMIGSNQFQYLCNKTTEFQLKTECHTVSGTRVKEGLDPKPYTWNIVGIESKKDFTVQKNYYLVDIAECKNNSAEYFMVGAQGTQGEYTTGNGTKYIPDEKSGKFTIANLKYKPDQDEFRFVLPNDVSDGKLISRELGGIDVIVEVEGNVYSNISFSSTVQEVATISRDPELKNRAQIHMLGSGQTVIWATAYETDTHAWRSIHFTLSVHEKENNDPQVPVEKPENPGGTGGNTGGSGSSGDIGGIGGGTGGSGGTGSVTTTVSSGPGELLPQIDFCLNSGTATILKSVGAEDFTITASGQVKDSTVTYASSDPSVATVDANTGTVHIVGSGNAVISATASKTTLHREEKCEYKLEVR